ncbi:hypothetical protein [Sediminibacillus massiliensis]|uniref:hypothetical protein n=1 Tax=Sediminibacillus massiliensis TaxID=1926277 RepID=UPI000988885E|nr:hypothetical protein [Sediminibacillus massiliensis]
MYLQMDGVDDKLSLPSMTLKDIVMDIEISDSNESGRHDYADYGGDTGTTAQFYRQDGDTKENANTFLVDGVERAEVTPLNRVTLKLVGWIDYTGPGTIFSHPVNPYFMNGKIWGVKVYDNSGSLVAHYDMSTGTVQDQSGNGNHATLYGGTWVDDGGGEEPTGEEVSYTYDIENRLYAERTNSYDMKQSIYEEVINSFDAKIDMYQDISQSYNTAQIIYETVTNLYDTFQEIYSDSIVRTWNYDLSLSLYAEKEHIYDTKQAWYTNQETLADLEQAIYKATTAEGDINLVIYADRQETIDTLQELYNPVSYEYDTRQTFYDEDKSIVRRIRLEGERNLNVYVAGERRLNVTIPGERKLNVTVKGVIQ